MNDEKLFRNHIHRLYETFIYHDIKVMRYNGDLYITYRHTPITQGHAYKITIEKFLWFKYIKTHYKKKNYYDVSATLYDKIYKKR